MTELTNRFTDERSSQAASCFLVTRLRRQLENDEYIHPEVRKLARLPQDFEVRDPTSGRRLSGAKNEIEANPHVRRRLSECTDLQNSPVGANKHQGAHMPRPMTGDEMMARAAEGALPGQANYEAFTPAPPAYYSSPTAGMQPAYGSNSGSAPTYIVNPA